MRDPIARSAARTATLIAVPVALLVGTIVFLLMNRGDHATSPLTRLGATTPVTMPASPLSPRAAIVCRALLSQIPESLHELSRRPVTAGLEQNAAYGDPPVTVACGVPPPRVAPTATVWNVSGVCWYADGAAYTTVDREVPVTVTVPAAYANPGDLVNELSRTLIATVLSASTAPSGCNR